VVGEDSRISREMIIRKDGRGHPLIRCVGIIYTHIKCLGLENGDDDDDDDDD